MIFAGLLVALVLLGGVFALVVLAVKRSSNAALGQPTPETAKIEAKTKIDLQAYFPRGVEPLGLQGSKALRYDNVREFVKHLDALIDAGDDPAVAEADIETPAVRVLTVHKAKGLE